MRTKVNVLVVLSSLSLSVLAACGREDVPAEPTPSTERLPARAQALLELETRVPEAPRRTSDWEPRRPLPQARIPGQVLPTDRLERPVTARYRSVLVHGDSRREDRIEVTRSRDRVQVSCPGGSREWLFELHPKDPTRIRGWLVDHLHGAILGYSWLDIVDNGLEQSWARLGGLGFEDATLGERREGSRQALGHTFVSWRREEGLIMTRVWWCGELGLPLEVCIESPEGSWTRTLETLDEEGADERIVLPWIRWPGYRRLDLADFREEYQCTTCKADHRNVGATVAADLASPMARKRMLQDLFERNRRERSTDAR